jgi:hypothetical protein
MYMYLVVKEADDGSWLSDPETFDTRADAKKYAAGREDHLKPGETWSLYECRPLDRTIDADL